MRDPKWRDVPLSQLSDADLLAAHKQCCRINQAFIREIAQRGLFGGPRLKAALAETQSEGSNE